MCGYTITKIKLPNLLKHRGIFERNIKHGNWEICFNSLPLSSFKTGIEQPIEISNYKIVFNGEIFNYKLLIKESNSDIHYLQLLMKKCQNDIFLFYKESLKWEGFWSISIIKKNGDVYCFTDPLGKKQLYYNSIGLSSEIKPLINNNEYLNYNELNFGNNKTNFKNIKRLIPSYLYLYKLNNKYPVKIKWQNYWYKINNNNLYEIIDKNIKLRLDNNYDGISLLLSGGLDSNIILHHVLKYTNNIDIVSIENNESTNIKEICNINNINTNFINDKYTDTELSNAILSYEHSLDYGSLLPNYLLFKSCKNSLVLTGDGADELFGGYNRAILNDTFYYDVFLELPYYHNIRLDRMSMAFTKEARSPLMSLELVRYCVNLDRKYRVNKKILRDLYSSYLPKFIIEGIKKPLRLNNDKNFNINLIKTKHKEIFNKNNN
jgi:asparagine synthase (glutamine-hydrolysing)